ncbi:winged helix-turn-helix domain-containing protein [Streptomyces sp. NPDC056437]|uniref:winged helix-turn-helix domain-containing protein n=1 Tax=Streptomyces sp. NPDC056437 TaxID=3345816 RepID=UPI0036A06140
MLAHPRYADLPPANCPALRRTGRWPGLSLASPTAPAGPGDTTPQVIRSTEGTQSYRARRPAAPLQDREKHNGGTTAGRCTVRTVIGWCFHLTYTVQSVRKLLVRNDWSFQVPSRRAMERDDDAAARANATRSGAMGSGCTGTCAATCAGTCAIPRDTQRWSATEQPAGRTLVSGVRHSAPGQEWRGQALNGRHIRSGPRLTPTPRGPVADVQKPRTLGKIRGLRPPHGPCTTRWRRAGYATALSTGIPARRARQEAIASATRRWPA